MSRNSSCRATLHALCGGRRGRVGRLAAVAVVAVLPCAFCGGVPARADERAPADAGASHWAFQPLPETVRLPSRAAVDARARTWIDTFIFARLAERGLEPVGEASRADLLRRLHFDLVGLPPTPEEIRDFLADDAPTAWEERVDRLLGSPHFGERWGRHWLDVARYADSTGGGRTRALDNAWRYRDYVIRSLNGDKPYDRFLREQVAGDLLDREGLPLDVRRDLYTATGFLVLGPNNYELQNKPLLRMEVVDEQIDTIGRSMLAMTLGCARCHDHKFDPVPTRDYYALAGIFRSTKTLLPGNVSGFMQRELPLDPEARKRLDRVEARIAAVKKRVDESAASVQELEKRVATLEAENEAPGILVDDRDAQVIGQWKRSTHHPKFVGDGYIHDEQKGKGDKSVRFTARLPDEGEYEVWLASTPGTNRAPRVPVTVLFAGGEKTVHVDQRPSPPIRGQFISLGSYRFVPDAPARVTVSNAGTTGHVIADGVRFVKSSRKNERTRSPELVRAREELVEARQEKKQLEQELAAVRGQAPRRPKVLGVVDEKETEDWHVLRRGELTELGEKVPRGFLTAVASEASAPEIADGESGRRELARWLTSPDNPLPARVWANRIWHHLLGAGLVRTVDNFGTMGETPSHPQLLDALARRLIDSGWSTKELVREIVTSRVYRLRARSTPALDRADPQNRLLGRAHRKRLEAEAFRDAALRVSGELDLRMGGPSIDRRGNSSPKIEYGYEYRTTRRSVYVPVFRNALFELFDVFDCADPNVVDGRRAETTRSTQALYLLNSDFLVERAAAAARRLVRETPGATLSERLREATLRALGRLPLEGELAVTRRLFESSERSHDDVEAWALCLQSIFASIDFRFLK